MADDPSPDDGTWQTSRTVNYRNGLARLQLSVRLPDGGNKQRGGVLLQSYNLADGSACLKAHLNWSGTEMNSIHSIFTKPGNDWKTEARRLAAQWMAGPPAAPVVTAVEEVIVAEAATG